MSASVRRLVMGTRPEPRYSHNSSELGRHAASIRESELPRAATKIFGQEVSHLGASHAVDGAVRQEG
eukprot:scaffold140516_cov36-Tisochrysis_lutea.AAC.2